MKLKCIVLFLVLGFYINAQSSYLSVVDYEQQLPDNVTFLFDIAVNESGELSSPYFGDGTGFTLVSLDASGVLSSTWNISTPDITDISWGVVDIESKANYSALLVVPYPTTGGAGHILFVIDKDTGNVWAKEINAYFYGQNRLVIGENGKVYVTSYPSEIGSTHLYGGVACIDLATGVQEWGAFYEKEGNLTTRITFTDIEEAPNGNISFALRKGQSGASVLQAGLIQLTAQGDLLQAVEFSKDSLEIIDHVVDQEQHTYIGARIAAGHIGDAIILKLDPNYNLLWAKRLKADKFEAANFKIQISTTGDLLFAYRSVGPLPVITGALSAQGELLWTEGYAFLESALDIAPDASFYMSSIALYDEQGNINRTKVLAKTDENGDIGDCPKFNACLYLEDMAIELEHTTWLREDPLFLTDVNASSSAVASSFYESCSVPPYPSPIFTLPDTICQYTCLAATELQNSLANYKEWRISGPSIDTVLLSDNIDWCFDTAGTYTITQEVWVLGCSESYSHQLEVLADDLQITLGEDAYICQDEAYHLVPSASRPLVSFEWSTGSNAPSIDVHSPAAYSLSASDGYCMASDTIALSLVSDLLTSPALSIATTDTTLCPDLLPYVLRPTSDYSTSFWINEDSTQQDSIFQLQQAASYTISTSIANCVFSQELNMHIEPCAVPIYIPNVFSPNGDGINDVLYAQGLDFEGLSLKVYDRWGGLVYSTKQQPLRWLGESASGAAVSTGVYVLVFEYYNKRTKQEEEYGQDVLLLR